MCDQICRHHVLPGDERRVVGVHVGDEVISVQLCMRRYVVDENRDPERSSNLPRQINEPRRLLCLTRLERAVRDVVDGRKEETECDTANEQRDTGVVLASLGGEMCKLPHRDEKDTDADVDEDARIDQRFGAIEETAAQERRCRGSDTAGEQRQARFRWREAQNTLREQREQERSAVQTEAERDEKENGRGEVAVFEDPEVDDRVFVPLRQLPPQHEDEGHAGEDRETQNQAVVEPVFLIPFFQYVLQRAEPDGE